jgi:2-methylisocitrate lyase-like PEP mutase family enzyme
VSYVDTGGHIEDLWRDGTGWHHRDLSAVTSASPTRLDISGYAFQGAQHAIYLGTAHHIEDLWWDQNGAHVEDLTALTNAPLSTDAITGYGFEADGTQHVILTFLAGVRCRWP